MRRGLALAVTVLTLLESPAALAQVSPAPTSTATSEREPAIDVTKLPIDVARIQRQLQTGATRQDDPLRLEYVVQVFAQAPRLVLLSPEEIRGERPVPGTAPSHSELFMAIAPAAHRASTATAFRRPGALTWTFGR